MGTRSIAPVLFAGILTVAIATSEHLQDAQPKYVLDGLHLFVTTPFLRLVVFDETDNVILNGKLGVEISSDLQRPSKCQDSAICLKWMDTTKLKIKREEGGYFIEWTTFRASRLEDQFDMTLGPWYGGSERLNQGWPIGNNPVSETAYVTNDVVKNPALFGNVLESYWISTTGAALYVPEDVPLFVSVNASNSHLLTLAAQNTKPYHTTFKQPLTLKYHIVAHSDPRVTHLWSVSNYLGKPQSLINETLVRETLWSTYYVQRPAPIQDSVLSFANDIRSYKFTSGQIGVSEDWESCFGTLSFDSSNFPDPAEMVNQLHEKGFRVTLWVHPFINSNCNTFEYASRNGYLVKNLDGSTAITSWWRGSNAGVIDFTNQKASAWYTSRLEDLRKETGVDGFKFDCGETNYLPYDTQLNSPLELQPNSYTTAYIDLASTLGNIGMVRTGRRTQRHPLLVGMVSRYEEWGKEAGLRSVVPKILQINIVGYPYMLGNGAAYSRALTSELYIRWLQAVTFMPALELSFLPWYFSDQVVEITHRYIKLHRQYANTIMSLALKAMTVGTPINLPLWWIDPKDEVAQKIDSEYLLGDSLLVAPVLEEGATSRDIYLPAGRWRDELNPNHPVYRGKQWLRNYPVPLPDLAYFTKVSLSD